jgi:hypothetical protein
MKISDLLICIFVSVAISVFSIVGMFRFGLFSTESEMFTIDIEKVFQAQQQLVGAAATGDFDASIQLPRTSQRVSEAIREVAGKDKVVLILPVVASQGMYDITDDVLKYLSLEPPKVFSGLSIDDLNMPDASVLNEFDSAKLYENFNEWDKVQSDKKKLKNNKDKIKVIIP